MITRTFATPAWPSPTLIVANLGLVTPAGLTCSTPAIVA